MTHQWTDDGDYAGATIEGSDVEVWSEDGDWSLSVQAPGLPTVGAKGCETKQLAQGMAIGIARGLVLPPKGSAP